MTLIQKIQLKMSEIREKLNGMMEIRVDDADQMTQRKRLIDQLTAQEVELRAAIDSRGRDQHGA